MSGNSVTNAGSSADSGSPPPGEPIRYGLEPNTVFPNSHLHVLVYRKVLAVPDAARFEQMFAHNGWPSAWRNGLFSVSHYHSTAHEVLGVYRGSVRVRFGGDVGIPALLEAGDVAVIPAGVAHKNEGASDDYRIVGAYPTGTGPDMQYGKPGERPDADRRIAALALPTADPVHGANGPLVRIWRPRG